MRVTLYRNGEAWKSFKCDDLDIITGDKEQSGALFLISKARAGEGIVIDAEIQITAEFGENSITLTQPVS